MLASNCNKHNGNKTGMDFSFVSHDSACHSVIRIVIPCRVSAKLLFRFSDTATWTMLYKVAHALEDRTAMNGTFPRIVRKPYFSVSDNISGQYSLLGFYAREVLALKSLLVS